MAVSVAQGDDCMTNFERIKEMSLKELAEFICERTDDCAKCFGCDLCRTNCGHANGLIAWLKKEVQDDATECL